MSISGTFLNTKKKDLSFLKAKERKVLPDQIPFERKLMENLFN